MKNGDSACASWNLAVPSDPSCWTGKTARPSGSVLDAINLSGAPPGPRPARGTQRIGDPSGFAEAGSSNVVPTRTWRPFGVIATIVDMRLGLPDTFTVYRSGR